MSRKKVKQREYGTELKLAAVRRVLAGERRVAPFSADGCPTSRAFRDVGISADRILGFYFHPTPIRTDEVAVNPTSTSLALGTCATHVSNTVRHGAPSFFSRAT